MTSGATNTDGNLVSPPYPKLSNSSASELKPLGTTLRGPNKCFFDASRFAVFQCMIPLVRWPKDKQVA